MKCDLEQVLVDEVCNVSQWGVRDTKPHHLLGGWSKGLGGTPICHYGGGCILESARTFKNGKKQFWDCPNYKVWSMVIIVIGCIYILLLEKWVFSVNKIFLFVGFFEHWSENEDFKGCNYFKCCNEDMVMKGMLPLVDKGERSIIWKNLLWLLKNGLSC